MITLIQTLLPEPVAPAAQAYYVLTEVSAEPVAATVAEPMLSLPLDWPSLGLAAWLAGALVFLIVRFRAYFDMRRELLAEARAIGWNHEWWERLDWNAPSPAI